MCQLGGGGPQTLFGWQVATGQTRPVGLAAGVGDDIPDSCISWLQGAGCDLAGLQHISNMKTPRAWQITEWDGFRTQIWRTPACAELYRMLRPKVSDIPRRLLGAKWFHLGINPDRPDHAYLAELRAATRDTGGGRFSIEPFVGASRPLTPPELSALVRAADVVSPNLAEARSMLGDDRATPQGALEVLGDAGASVAVIRCGADGAYAADFTTNEAYFCPPYAHTKVKDVTGCGNSFMGAFLAGFSGEAKEVAGMPKSGMARGLVWGHSAASFMAECYGVPEGTPRELHGAAVSRVESLLVGDVLEEVTALA
ncbi:unnamed protein product [Pedinophyceae sp. YPF-701]|nr:unnamed protein product [Pedinophyceae sp. YPF-701]